MNLNSNTFFLIVGRLGKSLVVSKAELIIANPAIDKLYIFSESKGYPITGAIYINLPKWLCKIRPKFIQKLIRHIFEPLQILIYAFHYKPKYINGIYTLPKGLYSVFISKIIGAKSIVSVIGGKREILTYLPFTFIWKKINLIILKYSDAVTTKGGVVTDYLINNSIKKEKIFTLNGSVNAKFDGKIDGYREIDVLFCGNFSKLKGPDRVLAIIKQLIKKNVPIKAAFLGNGSLFSFIESEIINNIEYKDIALYGYVKDTESFYIKSKLLLMPSVSEGLSTAMLEAMSYGCVPIVSNVGAMTEAAHHNINAMVVKGYDNIDDFVKFSHELLFDENKRNKLSKNGKKMVMNKYSPSAQSAELSKVLKFLESI